jgi:flagellar assembly factor FliW
MEIQTSRFGAVKIEADDILLFPAGMFAFDDCRHWVLLSDADNDSVAWLQSITRPNVALPVVSPRRFVPGYKVQITRGQLAPLQLTAVQGAYVLVVVSQNEQGLTLNLKAPIIVNLDARLGRQVITGDEQPLQYALPAPAAPLRKSA